MQPLALARDASEADVTGRGIDRLWVPGGGAIAPAIVGRAQMRAAFQDLAGDAAFGLAGVVAQLLSATARVLGDATGFAGVGGMPGIEPIGSPFPNVADHVVKAVSIRREGRDGRCTLVAVSGQVLPGKAPLP